MPTEASEKRGMAMMVATAATGGMAAMAAMAAMGEMGEMAEMGGEKCGRESAGDEASPSGVLRASGRVNRAVSSS